MLTPQAFKTEVVWSTFVLRLSSSLCLLFLCLCWETSGSPSTFLWNNFSSEISHFPPRIGFLVLQHMKTFLLDANKVFLCKGKKIVCCAWNYLLFRSVRISARADILQVVQGVLVVLSTPWVSCEKPPSNSGVLKSCPVPQPWEAFLMEKMWVPLKYMRSVVSKLEVGVLGVLLNVSHSYSTF